MTKPLTVWITTKCGKFLKRQEYQTLLPASWEICMQVKNHWLEPDMEQQTGSKLGKEYYKDVYFQPVFLTFIQSTSCEMLDWMNHKLKSRLLGKVSITSAMQISSVQFSRSVMSDHLQPHEPQHTRPPCSSTTPGVHPNPCPMSQWCHITISSSVVPFSSCPQSFPAAGSFQMSQLSTWGGQSIGVSASTSVPPMNWTNLLQDGLIGSPCSPRDSQESSPTPQFNDDTSLKGESKELLKSLLVMVKEDSEKSALKLTIPITQIMAYSPFTSWKMDGETMETVTRFIFLSFKIIVDGDYSHEIKMCLFLGRKTVTNLDSVLKSRDITLPTKIHIVQAMVPPTGMCRCES